MHCGGQHDASKCPFIDSERYKCRMKGHIARACSSGQLKMNKSQRKDNTLGRRTNKAVASPERQGIGCSIGDIIGTPQCKDIMAKIQLNPDVQPKFVKSRSIPHRVKGPVGDDLDRLERIGVHWCPDRTLQLDRTDCVGDEAIRSSQDLGRLQCHGKPADQGGTVPAS